MTGERPLEGLRVVEMGQLLAGPFAGTILGYFGAEVIKVEPPTGDPIRQWREVRDGTSLWYHSLARNKKSVHIKLKIYNSYYCFDWTMAKCKLEGSSSGDSNLWEKYITHSAPVVAAGS